MEPDEEIERLKERSWRETAAIDAALECGEIDEAGWHRAMAAVIVPRYLAGDSPRAQSGHSGDEDRWEGARRLVLDGVDRDGVFLDVGCASGHLMECVQSWAAEDGIQLEPWGLDISPELVALARRRLPMWAERIFIGNALQWCPPQRFDFVRTGLDYVPSFRRQDLIAHLLAHVVAAPGRLIIGVFNEETGQDVLEHSVRSWGFTVAGNTHRLHPESDLVTYKALWIDAIGE